MERCAVKYGATSVVGPLYRMLFGGDTLLSQKIILNFEGFELEHKEAVEDHAKKLTTYFTAQHLTCVCILSFSPLPSFLPFSPSLSLSLLFCFVCGRILDKRMRKTTTIKYNWKIPKNLIFNFLAED